MKTLRPKAITDIKDGSKRFVVSRGTFNVGDYLLLHDILVRVDYISQEEGIEPGYSVLGISKVLFPRLILLYESLKLTPSW